MLLIFEYEVKFSVKNGINRVSFVWGYIFDVVIVLLSFNLFILLVIVIVNV